MITTVEVIPPIAPVDSIPEPGPAWLLLLALCVLAVAWLVRESWGCPRRRRGWVYFSGGSGPVSSSTDRAWRIAATLPALVLLGAVFARLAYLHLSR